MKKLVVALCFVPLYGVGALAPAAEQDVHSALNEIRDAYKKVSAVEATVETRHETQEEEVVLTRSLVLSKSFGWKIVEGTGKLRREIINDFTTNYVYYPEQKRALKLVAKSADVAAEFRRPVAELNPIFSLDPHSLKLRGVEELAGEKVYHIEGTTTTQFLQSGKPVTVRIESWVSPKDGLPRKTVERWSDRTGTTIYREVRLRDDITSGEFQFKPPAGVEVIEIGADESQQ